MDQPSQPGKSRTRSLTGTEIPVEPYKKLNCQTHSTWPDLAKPDWVNTSCLNKNADLKRPNDSILFQVGLQSSMTNMMINVHLQ